MQEFWGPSKHHPLTTTWKLPGAADTALQQQL